MAQPTQELQEAITHLHQAIVTEQDPGHMATLGKCLTEMMKVQADIMQGSGSAGGNGNGGAQAPADSGAQNPGAAMAEAGIPGMGGGGYGPPPAGPETPANPLMALQSMGQ